LIHFYKRYCVKAYHGGREDTGGLES